MTDLEFRAALAALPQADAKICAHIDRYGRDSKATRVLLGVSLSVGTIETLNLSIESFCTLCKVKGALIKQKRSGERKSFDGKKAANHYRLQPARIKSILLTIIGDQSDSILPWAPGRAPKWWNKKSLQKSFDDFCNDFNCRLLIEPEYEGDDRKVYTHGDFFEYECWKALGEDPTHWRKNCRSHKSGTDCGQYEIKSACMYWAGSAILVGINQYI